MKILALLFLIVLAVHGLGTLQIENNKLFIALSAVAMWLIGAALSVVVLAS